MHNTTATKTKLTSASRNGLSATGIAAVLLAVICFVPLVASPAIAAAWGSLVHLVEAIIAGDTTLVPLSHAVAGGLVTSFLFARHATLAIDAHAGRTNATLRGTAFFLFIEVPAVALQLMAFINSPDMATIATSLEALGAAPHWMAQVGAVGLLTFALAPVVLMGFLYFALAPVVLTRLLYCCFGNFMATLDPAR